MAMRADLLTLFLITLELCKLKSVAYGNLSSLIYIAPAGALSLCTSFIISWLNPVEAQRSAMSVNGQMLDFERWNNWFAVRGTNEQDGSPNNCWREWTEWLCESSGALLMSGVPLCDPLVFTVSIRPPVWPNCNVTPVQCTVSISTTSSRQKNIDTT